MQPIVQNVQVAGNGCHLNYCNICTQLNGINTQGENIADNGGIKEAYYAYLRWTERNYMEPRLPGLDFSPRQMFWLSAAQTWCTKYRIQAMRQRITTGVHSLGQFRVLGPLSNMQEFSEDFNCPLGSPMNPIHKCQVW
jgi:predicted metalloendopeptidase